MFFGLNLVLSSPWEVGTWYGNLLINKLLYHLLRLLATSSGYYATLIAGGLMQLAPKSIQNCLNNYFNLSIPQIASGHFHAIFQKRRGAGKKQIDLFCLSVPLDEVL